VGKKTIQKNVNRKAITKRINLPGEKSGGRGEKRGSIISKERQGGCDQGKLR